MIMFKTTPKQNKAIENQMNSKIESSSYASLRLSVRLTKVKEQTSWHFLSSTLDIWHVIVLFLG